MKVFLLGKNGMLGSCFLKHLSGDKDFEVFAYDQGDFDITNPDEVDAVFAKISPDFVINCAAYTAVDDCETNKDLAFSVNGDALAIIATSCRRENASLVHFSTDYVFNGENSEGYREDDETGPISAYGESKLKGEKAIMDNMENYFIVRTSWLFGENGKNFVETMIRLGKERDELSVVGDQIGSPTYTNDLCEGVMKNFLAPFALEITENHEHILNEGGENVAAKPEFGIYHMTNSGSTSWFNFAKTIFEMMKMDVKVNEITSEEYKTPAKRPSCSILLNTKLKEPLRDWKEALATYLSINHGI